MNVFGVTRRCLVCAATGSFAAALIGSGRAQSSYPDRPIKIVVPYTAGSPNDTFARAVAPILALRMKQPVIVEDRPGGGTLVGLKAVTTAAADGYTLLFSNTPTHVIAQFVGDGIAYDPIRDFAPINAVGTTSLVLVVSARTPANSLQEFLAYATRHPGKLNFGFGQGTLPHLSAKRSRSPRGPISPASLIVAGRRPSPTCWAGAST